MYDKETNMRKKAKSNVFILQCQVIEGGDNHEAVKMVIAPPRVMSKTLESHSRNDAAITSLQDVNKSIRGSSVSPANKGTHTSQQLSGSHRENLETPLIYTIPWPFGH